MTGPIGITANQRALVDDAAFITGAPRSGTTLVGKIVSTLGGLEYHFEPPTFYMVLSMAATGRLSREAADALLHVHLYEDLLLESVHGRRANLRPTDDSLVLNAITWQELNERWRSIRNRADAVKAIREKGHRLAIKMPNIMDSADLLWERFPRSQVVLVAREGFEVIRSILKKGWVRKEGLEEELWPYRDAAAGARVPYWVEDAAAPLWAAWSEETRACHMWRVHARHAKRLAEARASDAKRFRILRFEDLLAKPRETVQDLAAFLGRPLTRLTEDHIRAVRSPASRGEPDRDAFLARVDPAELDLVREVNRSWGYGA